MAKNKRKILSKFRGLTLPLFIEMILEEKEAQETLKSYRPSEMGFHTITL
jgi:hypothetical protein